MLPAVAVAPVTVYLKVTLGALLSAVKELRSMVTRAKLAAGRIGATEVKVEPSVLKDHVPELNPVFDLWDA